MIDLTKYELVLANVELFNNGKLFTVFSRPTKKGLRYYYYSIANMRMMPVSKYKIGIA